MERELAAAFVLQSDINMAILKDNALGQDPVAWHEAAHMFKGGAGGIGAGLLHKLCATAQDFDGNFTQRAELYMSIHNEYAKVKEELAKLGLINGDQS
jgi:HPt (histidine-containing phosphotransfer) domain-containing protein